MVKMYIFNKIFHFKNCNPDGLEDTLTGSPAHPDGPKLYPVRIISYTVRVSSTPAGL